MNQLSREIIDRLSKEDDTKILTEVLDFYEFLEQKKIKELNIKLIEKKEDILIEDILQEDEVKIYHLNRDI